ncbi:hypothetical protein [Kocuria sp. U4B]
MQADAGHEQTGLAGDLLPHRWGGVDIGVGVACGGVRSVVVVTDDAVQDQPVDPAGPGPGGAGELYDSSHPHGLDLGQGREHHDVAGGDVRFHGPGLDDGGVPAEQDRK